MIRSIPTGALFKWGLRDREPLSSWTKGRAGLQRLDAGYVRQLRRLVRGARQGTVDAVRLLPQA
jgi:hypothetical protein